MTLKIELLATLEEALELASVRNQCRHWMTHHQQEISHADQVEWFETFYSQQNPPCYWVWLLKEKDRRHEKIVGYYAAKENEEGIYITEGILEDQRGKGLGSFLMCHLLSHKALQHKPIYADIFNHNIASLRLHQKWGFTEYSKVNEEITRFMWKKATC